MHSLRSVSSLYNKRVRRLSRNIDDFYLNDYESIMNGGLVGKMWEHVHNSLDKPFLGLNGISLIEVGSGNGQHFNLSKISTKEYVEVDIRESSNSGVNLQKAESLGRRFVIDDATRLSKFSDEYFDGLVATCLLAHLAEIEETLTNWRRVVKEGGILSIYMPNEPGIFLRIARSLTTKRRIIKHGYNHEYIHWKEHRNHLLGMKSVIKHVFRDDSVRFRNFPFPFLTWNFGLYTLVKVIKK